MSRWCWPAGSSGPRIAAPPGGSGKERLELGLVLIVDAALPEVGRRLVGPVGVVGDETEDERGVVASPVAAFTPIPSVARLSVRLSVRLGIRSVSVPTGIGGERLGVVPTPYEHRSREARREEKERPCSDCRGSHVPFPLAPAVGVFKYGKVTSNWLASCCTPSVKSVVLPLKAGESAGMR